MKRDLQAYERLVDDRVQLMVDQNIFEFTTRQDEVKERLQENKDQAHIIARSIQTGGELLIALEDECSILNTIYNEYISLLLKIYSLYSKVALSLVLILS